MVLILAQASRIIFSFISFLVLDLLVSGRGE